MDSLTRYCSDVTHAYMLMNITSGTTRVSIGGGERAAGCEGCLGTVRLPFWIRQDRDRYLPEGSPHPPSLRGAHGRWYGTARYSGLSQCSLSCRADCLHNWLSGSTQYINPCPGLVVDATAGKRSITNSTINEFYLNSHATIQVQRVFFHPFTFTTLPYMPLLKIIL